MFQDSVNKLLVHLVLEKCSSSKNNTILAMNLEWILANGWATKKVSSNRRMMHFLNTVTKG